METQAEKILRMARMVLYPRDVLIESFTSEEHLPSVGRNLALVKLSLDFKRKSAALHLRAILENWDQQRIVREVY